ncbi:hypothetical protein EYF80_031180 [Liparis tanakae]|uniref:Uncharacterized protein n=1 Tax=Liparis tanakae TaxID=230148 RepID=A0A4Z2GZ79_9TELE|nr:hypothetical protein EYF80_031180 [Liparis tanakae]
MKRERTGRIEREVKPSPPVVAQDKQTESSSVYGRGLWLGTDASFRQVSSAMSSTLLNLGGFIFWMSSLLITTFLPFSASSSCTSSPRSSRMLAASKPLRSEGIHTSFLAVQSACVAGL